MSFCPSVGNPEWCYTLGILPLMSAVLFGSITLRIIKKPSFIDFIMNLEEFEENQTLIERYRTLTNLKVAACLLNAIFCLGTVAMLAVMPREFSFVMPILMAVQGLNWIGCSWLTRKEYSKQGRSSMSLFAIILFDCAAQSIAGAITLVLQDEEENDLNKQELSALVLLEITSILTLALFIVKKTDFTSEALLLQSHFLSTDETRSTAVTASLLQNDEEIQKDKQDTLFKINLISPNQGNIDKPTPDQEKKEYFTQATSFLSQRNFIPQSATLNQNPLDQLKHEEEENEDQPKQLKVIGYKAKNQQMIFVISFIRNGSEQRTQRTHKDFKYLATILSEQLKESCLSLPQLPRRIKETAELDITVLRQKMLKYNRFLFYLEFNQIKSQAFDEFLLPISQKPFFKPLEGTISDAQTSSSSSCSENDTLTVANGLNSTKNQLQTQNRNQRANSSSAAKSTSKTTNQSDNRIRSSTEKDIHNNTFLENKGSQNHNQTMNILNARVKIPQVQDISGTTFYTILIRKSKENTITISKRFQQIKNCHLSIKTELKNLVEIPELPYKPSSDSNLSLIDFRQKFLPQYFSKMCQIPQVIASQAFRQFLAENSS